jgi:hypothetical protein
MTMGKAIAGNHLDGPEHEEQCQESNLAQGENVHALERHVLRVALSGILPGLHEEHHEAEKKMISLETFEARQSCRKV